ncbi:MAG TPA: extracellular solute-binding protein, partial [Armatimonadota bacterium]|nr:extracellular solute-binding protein [Armatimonadota bacterium]
MKWVFAGVLLLFAGMGLVAWATLVPAETPGVVRIRWATDANPARDVQTRLFSEMYPGVEVVVDPGLGGDQTKLIVQCATGTGPDVVDVYSKEQMMALVDAGILLDLTPYAETMGFGVDKTYPAMEGGLVVDGRQYRFPCNVWANCVVYNKRIFDDHGVPYPRDGWTWDEFIRVGKQLKETPS